jgi:ribosomal protein S8E
LGVNLKPYPYYSKKKYDEYGSLVDIESSKNTIQRKQQRYRIFEYCANCNFKSKSYTTDIWLGEEPKYTIVKDKYNENTNKKIRIAVPEKTKKLVYERANNNCQECGKSGNGDIHHIDSNPSNNNISNLILLCKNHHADADKGVISKYALKIKMGKSINIKHTKEIFRQS